MGTPRDDSSNPAAPFVSGPPVSRIDRLKAFAKRFGADRVTDQAAGLTYYTVLSAFPMLIALISVLKIIGQSERVQPAIDELISRAVPNRAMVGTLTEVVHGFLHSGGAGLGLLFGLVLALWSASGYVGAFGRAANSLYGVEESRNILVLKAQQLGLTALLVVIQIAMVVAFTAGPLLNWIGRALGSQEGVATVWTWLRWPVIAVLLVAMVSALFRFAPDTSGRRVGLVSHGSLAAIGIALLAVGGFNLYVSGFGNYEKTYGALAGIVVALLLIWLVSIALLVGVIIDDEHGNRSRAGSTGGPAPSDAPYRD